MSGTRQLWRLNIPLHDLLIELISEHVFFSSWSAAFFCMQIFTLVGQAFSSVDLSLGMLRGETTH